jgi:hypothetical protein
MVQSNHKALLVWCQAHTTGYAGVHVTNFSSSWVDGLAFCALLNTFCPDKIDFSDLDPEEMEKNVSLAFRVAKDTFGIEELLHVDDLTTNTPDPNKVVTYLSECFNKLQNETKKVPQPLNTGGPPPNLPAGPPPAAPPPGGPPPNRHLSTGGPPPPRTLSTGVARGSAGGRESTRGVEAPFVAFSAASFLRPSGISDSFDNGFDLDLGSESDLEAAWSSQVTAAEGVDKDTVNQQLQPARASPRAPPRPLGPPTMTKVGLKSLSLFELRSLIQPAFS